MLRAYFALARREVERHGGAIEKFIGDAVVGMFGVPATPEGQGGAEPVRVFHARAAKARLGVDLSRSREGGYVGRGSGESTAAAR